MSTNELSGGLRRGTDLAQVLLACQAATPADASHLLRKAYAAVAEELAMTAAFFGELPPPGQFEAMLLCGALESAALTLLPRGASFMLSCGSNHCHLGSVFMPECGEHTAEGTTAALALMVATLSAWRELLHAPTARPSRLN
ncbi:MAG: hypothetical protein ABIQ81_05555 [Novosphingobium sp.]